jgi:hypothetical protein
MQMQFLLNFGLSFTLALGLNAVPAVAADGPPQLDARQVEAAVRYIWYSTNRHRQRLCDGPVIGNPDQINAQEMELRFAPGQWIARFRKSGGRDQQNFNIRQLDLLARHGLVDKSESRINVGPLAGVPAWEYSANLAGWLAKKEDGGGSGSSLTPCFHYGMREMPRVTGYTLSEADSDGYRTVTVTYTAGLTAIEPWARDPEAPVLFRLLREAAADKQATFTFYRAPDGSFESTRRSTEKLVGSPRNLSASELELDAKAVTEGIEFTRRTPSDPASGGEPVPEPCWLLLRGRGLWQKDNVAAAGVAIFEAPAVSGGALDVQAEAYARLAQLARAGILTLSEMPRTENGTRKFLVRPRPQLADLLVRHGGCLPVGETRLQIDAMYPDENSGSIIRFKARYLVTQPAPWLTQVADKGSLPDLAVLLNQGLPFTGAVYKTIAGWRAAYLRTEAPIYRRASAAAAGSASLWQKSGAPLIPVEGRDVRIINGTLSSEAQSAPGAPRGTIEVYVNPGPRPVILVLNSYWHTQWKITASPQAKVDAILAIGYERQTVTGATTGTAVMAVHRDIRAVDDLTSANGAESGEILRKLGVPSVNAIEANESKPIFINQRD